MTNTTTPATPDGLAALERELATKASVHGSCTHGTSEAETAAALGRFVSENIYTILLATGFYRERALSTPLADNGLAEAREAAAREVEGDCDNPIRVREANGIREGKLDNHPTVVSRLAALRSPMPVTAEGVDALERLDEEWSDCGNFGWCHREGSCTRHNPEAYRAARREALSLTTKADAAGEGVEPKATTEQERAWAEAIMRANMALYLVEPPMRADIDAGLKAALEWAASRTPSQANDAAGQGEVDTRVLAEAAMAKARDEYHELYSAELKRLREALNAVNSKIKRAESFVWTQREKAESSLAAAHTIIESALTTKADAEGEE